MPQEDTHLEGHKFPYNACELLCSENNFIIDKLADVLRIEEEDSNANSDSVEEPESNNEVNDQHNEAINEVLNEHDIAKDDIDEFDEFHIKEEEYSNMVKGGKDIDVSINVYI
jgi:hypothetical protein